MLKKHVKKRVSGTGKPEQESRKGRQNRQTEQESQNRQPEQKTILPGFKVKNYVENRFTFHSTFKYKHLSPC